jgi:hypothetical protein
MLHQGWLEINAAVTKVTVICAAIRTIGEHQVRFHDILLASVIFRGLAERHDVAVSFAERPAFCRGRLHRIPGSGSDCYTSVFPIADILLHVDMGMGSPCSID